MALNATSVPGDIFKGAFVTDSEVQRWGLGVVQEIDSAAMHVLARWQHQELDTTIVGVSLNEARICSFGSVPGVVHWRLFDQLQDQQSWDDWDLFQARWRHLLLSHNRNSNPTEAALRGGFFFCALTLSLPRAGRVSSVPGLWIRRCRIGAIAGSFPDDAAPVPVTRLDRLGSTPDAGRTSGYPVASLQGYLVRLAREQIRRRIGLLCRKRGLAAHQSTSMPQLLRSAGMLKRDDVKEDDLRDLPPPRKGRGASQADGDDAGCAPPRPALVGRREEARQ